MWKCFPLWTVYTSLLEALAEVESTNRQPTIQRNDRMNSGSHVNEKVHSLNIPMSYE